MLMNLSNPNISNPDITPLSSIEEEEYREKFQKVVAELAGIGYGDLNSLTVRNWEVEQLLEEYLVTTGGIPEPYELTLLSNYILAETLKSPENYTTHRTEYPIRTTYSEKITPAREYVNEPDILDYLFSKYQLELDSLKRTTYHNKGFDD